MQRNCFIRLCKSGSFIYDCCKSLSCVAPYSAQVHSLISGLSLTTFIVNLSGILTLVLILAWMFLTRLFFLAHCALASLNSLPRKKRLCRSIFTKCVKKPVIQRNGMNSASSAGRSDQSVAYCRPYRRMAFMEGKPNVKF